MDLTGGDWAADLVTHLDRTADSWSEPGAWEGTTHMGGPTELPASLVGGMVVVEMLVHGWDLAKATDQRLELDDDLLDFVHEEVAKTAEQGRAMDVYGAEVTVTPSSSTLDKLLGLTGRDPAWTH